MDGTEAALLERGLRHAAANLSGAELDQALAGLGWPEAVDADARTAVTMLFSLQGEANTDSAALDHLLATATLGRAGTELARVAVAGDGAAATVAVALPAPGRAETAGRVTGDHCRVDGIATAVARRRQRLLVIADAEGGRRDVEAVVLDVAALDRRPVEGLDPALGLVRLGGEAPVLARRSVSADDWGHALALGRLALGHEMVGSARRMLELGRQHALERVQFERPIASFQAVRHRLADALVALEGAAALLDAAWDELSPTSAAVAKGFTGRAASTVAAHCQQVLGGIGFTTEHPLHRHVRRTMVLDQLLGSSASLTRRLGEEILSSRQLPAPVPL